MGGSPSTGDTATFDASSGGGTVTPNTTISIVALVTGAFTGTLAFNTNNNVTLSQSGTALNISGSGTRTINPRSGTWTFSGRGALDATTQTNCTPCVYSNATYVFNGNTAGRTINGGGQTFGAVSIGSNATKGYTVINGSNSFASLTIADGNAILFANGATNTISGALAITGTSSSPVALQSSNPSTGIITVSVGYASTIDWGSILRVTKSGVGSIAASNSFDLGGNTSITITPPSAGGSCSGRIIGG
jgi:hypothetical protein